MFLHLKAYYNISITFLETHFLNLVQYIMVQTCAQMDRVSLDSGCRFLVWTTWPLKRILGDLWMSAWLCFHHFCSPLLSVIAHAIYTGMLRSTSLIDRLESFPLAVRETSVQSLFWASEKSIYNSNHDYGEK